MRRPFFIFFSRIELSRTSMYRRFKRRYLYIRKMFVYKENITVFYSKTFVKLPCLLFTISLFTISSDAKDTDPCPLLCQYPLHSGRGRSGTSHHLFLFSFSLLLLAIVSPLILPLLSFSLLPVPLLSVSLSIQMVTDSWTN